MENKKRCIFHIPNKLDEKSLSGSQVRPKMMVQAFKNIGYDVDVVMGYGKERKKSIKEIKNNIKSGVKYDFLYSESSTMPTLLTEKNHLPLYPNLDFGFFKFCKNHGIKIGLFYRDIYWRFSKYTKDSGILKYVVSQIAYKYDLNKYEKLIDVLYVPSKNMGKYIRREKLSKIMDELPPGCDINSDFINNKKKFYENRLKNNDKTLNIFYVGGISDTYDFEEFLKAINYFDNINLVICCREKEWKIEKNRLNKYINERVQIVHKSGHELDKYYKDADLALAYFRPFFYRDMAVPIKYYEYLAHVIPIFSSDNTLVGQKVTDDGIGFTIPYNSDCARDKLDEIIKDYEIIYNKHLKCLDKVVQNTWRERAKKVAYDLK